MNKAKFFAMLDDHLDSHNNTWDGYGNRIPRQDRQYRADEIEAYTQSETEEKIAELIKTDPKYPWIFHSSGWVLAGCWYITAISHKTEEAALKQHEIFTRWIADYQKARA